MSNTDYEFHMENTCGMNQGTKTIHVPHILGLFAHRGAEAEISPLEMSKLVAAGVTDIFPVVYFRHEGGDRHFIGKVSGCLCDAEMSLTGRILWISMFNNQDAPDFTYSRIASIVAYDDESNIMEYAATIIGGRFNAVYNIDYTRP